MRYKEEDGCYNIVITETVTLLSKYYDKDQFSDDTSCSASPVQLVVMNLHTSIVLVIPAL